MTPRRLNTALSRQIARRTRDWHWDFMHRLARQGIVHVCLWNKYRHKERRTELRCGLIDGMELMAWVRAHRRWFRYGPHDRQRNAFPMWLTPAGKLAARQRAHAHDRAPVLGGLVDPGYQAEPREFHRDLNEQRERMRERCGLSQPTFIRPLRNAST